MLAYALIVADLLLFFYIMTCVSRNAAYVRLRHYGEMFYVFLSVYGQIKISHFVHQNN